MKPKYKLPEHLEPYREYLNKHAGGNKVEELIDRLHNEKGLAFSNIIVYTMAYGVQEQIFLLELLHKDGRLK